MRVISSDKISQTVAELCVRANQVLRSDVYQLLRSAYKKEKNRRAKLTLEAILRNASIARREKLAICQDTGLPVVFLEVGQEVKILGDLKSAVNKGVEAGYRKGYFRNSVIPDPLLRGRSAYQPAIIHTDIVRGSKLKITVLPRGFGCENKSRLKMFNPTAKLTEIKKFVIDTVKSAGPDACPPYVVGVGIGGTADYAGILAKKALIRKLNAKRSTLYAKLESELLKEINRLKIGPMGLGGKATCLAVNIETYPTHIAGLPVAVDVSCHALRSATIVL
jgi:fumarate hydratase subunit alpha